jgi:hypothetical protein
MASAHIKAASAIKNGLRRRMRRLRVSIAGSQNVRVGLRAFVRVRLGIGVRVWQEVNEVGSVLTMQLTFPKQMPFVVVSDSKSNMQVRKMTPPENEEAVPRK